MKQGVRADNSGSREPSPEGLGPSGFDPGRDDTLAQIIAVGSILKRIRTRAQKRLEGDIHAVLGRTGKPLPYSSDLLAALDTIPQGWWWHLSHLECCITPNAPGPLIPVSNATDYKHDGRPIGYSAGFYGRRTELPLLVIEARLKALMALLRKRRAVECGNYQHVDTGNGPLVATPEGKLSEIHYNRFLTADNKLRRRRKGDRGAIDPVFVYSTPACDKPAIAMETRRAETSGSVAKP
jgi:hypothetical protein